MLGAPALPMVWSHRGQDAKPSCVTVLAETSEGVAVTSLVGVSSALIRHRNHPLLPEGCRAPRPTGIVQVACSPSTLPSHGPLL